MRCKIMHVYIFISCGLIVLIIYYYFINHIRLDYFVNFKKFQSSVKPGCDQGPAFISSNFLSQSGLGNVMFQLASLYGIAKHFNTIPVIPHQLSLSQVFEQFQKHGIYMWQNVNVTKTWAQFSEIKSNRFDSHLWRKLTPCVNTTIVGYFQSYKYFDHCKRSIKKLFTIKRSLELEVHKFLHEAAIRKWRQESSKKLIYIGVHVRRGDFLEVRRQMYGYTVADRVYFIKAFTYYNSILLDYKPIYVVASDDIQWCRDHFKDLNGTVIYSEGRSPAFDLALMSKCNHSIITVGTFSWWSGWLAGGRVTYYKGFPKENSRLAMVFSKDKRDYYPDSWLGL